MSHKTIINIFLIIACISLAVFLINTGDNGDQHTVIVTSIQPGTIDHISINRVDRDEIKFEKRNDAWFMTAPLEVRANHTRIGAMLEILQSESFTQFPVAGHDLERFDLASPAISLKLNDQEILFGGTNPLEGRRYIMTGTTIHLITDGLYPQLQQGPVFFINPQLIPTGTLLRSIKLPNLELSFINNRWAVTDGTDISEASLEQLVATWQSAWATGMEILKPADSLGEVIIHTRTGEVMRFEIQQREPILKLARADLGITYDLSAVTTEELFLTEVRD